MPWQVYMVPQFLLMREFGLNNTHLALICLQAFTAFGVFLMRQFYMSIPDELCEAARIDGMSEYQIWWRIMLPLSKPALSTLTIFTFVTTWNDFLGPLIYLTKTELKTIQIGLRMFISAVFGRIRADHGRLGGVADPGADRLPRAATLLRRRHRLDRAERMSHDLMPIPRRR